MLLTLVILVMSHNPYHTVCVYRGLLWSIPIENQDFVHFHFQFEVNFTFNDIKVKNM